MNTAPGISRITTDHHVTEWTALIGWFLECLTLIGGLLSREEKFFTTHRIVRSSYGLVLGVTEAWVTMATDSSSDRDRRRLIRTTVYYKKL